MFSVEEPRIRRFESSKPGRPLDVTPMTPGIVPCSDCVRLVVGSTARSSPEIWLTEPVVVATVCSWYPTFTTTSSRAVTAGSSWTSISERPSMGTVCSWYPTKEKTSVSSSDGASTVKLPSERVVVPICVPCTTTFTPGRVRPSSASVTTPVTSC